MGRANDREEEKMLGDAGLFISHLLCPKIAESQVFVLCVFRVEGVMQACPSFLVI